ncbi:hypothetical protein HDU92_003873 [Lobulomyces angularis]|nr:hypothetical protein HDU92_003873 [Lobulomyces angularis]
MKKEFLLTAYLAFLCFSHGILTSPKARPDMAIAPGIKYQPRPPTAANLQSCMDSPLQNYTEVWESGSNVTIKWDTTIPHPNPPGVKISVQFNLNSSFITLVEGLDITLNQYTLKLPEDKVSDHAVVQWIWDSEDDKGFYLGCGDVKIVEKDLSNSKSSTAVIKAAPSSPSVSNNDSASNSYNQSGENPLRVSRALFALPTVLFAIFLF